MTEAWTDAENEQSF